MVHVVYAVFYHPIFLNFFSENWGKVYLEYKINLCTYLEKNNPSL